MMFAMKQLLLFSCATVGAIRLNSIDVLKSQWKEQIDGRPYDYMKVEMIGDVLRPDSMQLHGVWEANFAKVVLKQKMEPTWRHNGPQLERIDKMQYSCQIQRGLTPPGAAKDPITMAKAAEKKNNASIKEAMKVFLTHSGAHYDAAGRKIEDTQLGMMVYEYNKHGIHLPVEDFEAYAEFSKLVAGEAKKLNQTIMRNMTRRILNTDVREAPYWTYKAHDDGRHTFNFCIRLKNKQDWKNGIDLVKCPEWKQSTMAPHEVIGGRCNNLGDSARYYDIPDQGHDDYAMTTQYFNQVNAMRQKLAFSNRDYNRDDMSPLHYEYHAATM